ncbi:MAG: hypothetical protein GXO23_00915 [Crenarchaeota archaeon]|nr:hypothetical protein [Thermoproteota archaeon]
MFSTTPETRKLNVLLLDVTAVIGGYIYSIDPNLIYPTAVAVMTGTLIALTRVVNHVVEVR